jgi:purine-binding chemotaxis protein CheW
MNEAESILQARARALAKRTRAPDAIAARELITFALGRDLYGVATQHVREVFRPRDLSLLPGAEAPVHAVLPWRGVLLTVLDVRATLGIGGRGITDLSHLLVLGIEALSVGVLIHTVHDVVQVPESELLEPPRRGSGNNELLIGMTRSGVLVLDAGWLIERYA